MITGIFVLNFQKQFASLIESGSKRTTIRVFRKDGKKPVPGQTLRLYTGMRTAYCRKLLDAVCQSVSVVVIDEQRIEVDGRPLTVIEQVDLAKGDGFDCLFQFVRFFEDTHGLPFTGYLIRW